MMRTVLLKTFTCPCVSKWGRIFSHQISPLHFLLWKLKSVSLIQCTRDQKEGQNLNERKHPKEEEEQKVKEEEEGREGEEEEGNETCIGIEEKIGRKLIWRKVSKEPSRNASLLRTYLLLPKTIMIPHTLEKLYLSQKYPVGWKKAKVFFPLL